MLLRNPTLRACSGFLQCYPYLRDNLTGNETSTLGNTTLAHQLFASLARLEMDVVDNCPVPVGSGNFGWPRALSNRACRLRPASRTVAG